ncbi:hypothetical protein BEN30_07925 [Magnetovibrio blakemorei]|uniref:Uncharacterized protein n=1 Tax=Magnetovibrio blakemorei TaxID=28181 RepID=A0A1E5Q9S4_9PROT|nr:hypothetical protein BEN30_07925 [Magnetovibrio blakemorei]
MAGGINPTVNAGLNNKKTGLDVYRRVNNSRYVVVGISGIVVVMSVFTYLMWGIANRIDTMTQTIVAMGTDLHTMTEVQKVMVQDIGAMSTNIASIQTSVQGMDAQLLTVSRNMAIMTGSTVGMNANVARMSHDVGRSTSMFSSPMNYFWNMGQ